MKTINETTIQRTSRTLLSVMLAAAVMFFAGNCKDDDDTQPTSYTVSGNAAGSQMVPAVSGSGTGTITGTYNPTTRVMTYTSGWNGLSGAPTAAGFYTGASGVNGTATGSAWTIAPGVTNTGSMSGTITLTSEQASSLTNGNMYYSYGTTTNPNGEVRGQITATAVK